MRYLGKIKHIKIFYSNIYKENISYDYLIVSHITIHEGFKFYTKFKFFNKNFLPNSTKYCIAIYGKWKNIKSYNRIIESIDGKSH